MAVNTVGGRGTGAGGGASFTAWQPCGASRALRVLTIAVAALAAAALPAGAQLGIDIGAKAPAARVQTLDGHATDLAHVIGKAPLVIEFWATWCPSCKQLEPELQRLHAKYGSTVAFIGISVSANQKPPVVQRYLERYPMPWTQFYDHEGEATGGYDVPATSYVVIVNRSGTVVYTGLGGDQRLEPVIAALK